MARAAVICALKWASVRMLVCILQCAFPRITAVDSVAAGGVAAVDSVAAMGGVAAASGIAAEGSAPVGLIVPVTSLRLGSIADGMKANEIHRDV